MYLGNQTLVPPPPPQHCHWGPELKNTMIADFLVAKATLEIAGLFAFLTINFDLVNFEGPSGCYLQFG